MPEDQQEDVANSIDIKQLVQDFVFNLQRVGFNVDFDTVELDDKILLTIMAEMPKG